MKKRNFIVCVFVICSLIFLFAGCYAGKVREEKFELSCSFEEKEYYVGDTIEINAEFVNNGRKVRVETGPDGPIRYALYINDIWQVPDYEWLVAIYKIIDKDSSAKRTITCTFSESGEYRFELSAKFTMKNKEYEICKKEIVIQVTEQTE